MLASHLSLEIRKIRRKDDIEQLKDAKTEDEKERAETKLLNDLD